MITKQMINIVFYNINDYFLYIYMQCNISKIKLHNVIVSFDHYYPDTERIIMFYKIGKKTLNAILSDSEFIKFSNRVTFYIIEHVYQVHKEIKDLINDKTNNITLCLFANTNITNLVLDGSLIEYINSLSNYIISNNIVTKLDSKLLFLKKVGNFNKSETQSSNRLFQVTI